MTIQKTDCYQSVFVSLLAEIKQNDSKIKTD